ncbi:murein hydrolase activator EnvC family protein [Chryseomicrobium aureum]|uniref:murein hydrolase activator EnvC family protein n=1 Tax=Chryseomicrobium aureum TaxID=1441723 RepID=UPI001EF79A25|nr:peptidoglycan DD-metalloendopeptidase family protein [Chryseomicrobium aureum]MBM7705194.1 murein DD-endopeptidase MepM/ murein hydrolase activator NlpD [Chryseomicrobium aureum]
MSTTSRKVKMATWLTAATLLFTSGTVSAANLDELKEQQQELEQQKNELNSSIEQKKGEIQEKASEISTIEDKVQKLSDEIVETEKKIEEVLAEIEVTQNEIADLRASIVELEKKIEERDALLRDRIRAVQLSGGSVNYVDVLLGANSFIDFIDRFSAVNTLMEADRQIIRDQAADKKQLEEEKALVEQKLQQQEDQKAELLKLKESLDGQKAQMNDLLDQLEEEQNKLKNEQQAMETDYEEIANLSEETKNKIVAEQQRIAEIARQQAEEQRRKEAAERKAREEAAARNANSGGGSSNTAPAVSAPAVSAGAWTKPVNGRLTSGYGYRVHPIYGTGRMHYGVDFANSIGTPVVSAAAGVVSYAAPFSTYGNVVMVTHNIDGQTFTSLYAHLDSIGASVGQSVGKGQQIGTLGNTGNSTGPHLHFEIHVGGWNGMAANSVNPLRYIPM